MTQASKPGAETTRIWLKYDAWNRLTEVDADSGPPAPAGGVRSISAECGRFAGTSKTPDPFGRPLALEGFSWGAFDAEFLPRDIFASAGDASMASSLIQAGTSFQALALDAIGVFQSDVLQWPAAEQQFRNDISDDLSTIVSTLFSSIPLATSADSFERIPGFRDMGPEAKEAIGTRLLRLGAKYGKEIAPRYSRE